VTAYESHRYKERRGTWKRDIPRNQRYPLQDDDGKRRYYVAILTGWQDLPPGRGSSSLGYQIHDRDYCHVVIGVYDECTHRDSGARREAAHKRARELNEREGG
jgi:hypothetical protein